MMDFVFKEKIDTDKKTAINPITKVEQLTNLRRKHKEEEAEQVVQEVEQQKEGDRESHPNTLLRIRFNVWLTMFIFGESLIGAGAIVHAVGGSHMVVGGLLLAGAITVFVSFSIMVWKTLKGPFN